MRRELDVVLPFPEAVLQRGVPSPRWQHHFKDSALPIEKGRGLCSVLGVNHHPDLGSVAAEEQGFGCICLQGASY